MDALMTLRDNYLDFTGDAGGNFAQQYLPELTFIAING